LIQALCIGMFSELNFQSFQKYPCGVTKHGLISFIPVVRLRRGFLCGLWLPPSSNQILSLLQQIMTDGYSHSHMLFKNHVLLFSIFWMDTTHMSGWTAIQHSVRGAGSFWFRGGGSPGAEFEKFVPRI
jgi:hypothetical protein